MRILVMGLPGSGKTEFSNQLKQELIRRNQSVTWYSADLVREDYNDWDFSVKGRIRQANRMKDLSIKSSLEVDFVISDFVAPTVEIRNIFNADLVIFMDTIEQGRYPDTNKVFERPKYYDYIINNFDYSIEKIVNEII